MNAAEKVKLKKGKSIWDPIDEEAHLQSLECINKFLQGEFYVFKMNRPNFENQ